MEQYVAGGVKGFSPQTDLYSLAATLYYLLAGYPPPEAPSLAEQELTFPAQIPARLIEPISKAMASRRQERHESVGAFLDDLEGADAGSSRRQPQTQPEEEATEIVFPQKKASLQPKPAETREKSAERQEEADGETAADPKRSYNWVWFAAAACIGLAICIFAGSGWFPGPDAPKGADTEATSPAPQSVEGLVWESPLGKCVYSGEVMTDAATGEQIPDGKGVAKILGGEYGGCTYDGEFRKGTFEGETVYTLVNGDTFEGTFVNNEYSTGKYTEKESGGYFIGTFKNGEPDAGTLYDKDGNIIE